MTKGVYVSAAKANENRDTSSSTNATIEAYFNYKINLHHMITT